MYLKYNYIILPMYVRWLLDGQQRLASLRDFTQDAFPVFGDVYFSKLDKLAVLRRLMRQPFPCFELEYTDNEDVLKELYDRLNYGGTPHLKSERVRPTALIPGVSDAA